MKYVYITLTVILWASAFVAIRISLQEYGSFELALFRYIVASLAMAMLAPIMGIRIPDKKDWAAICLTGFIGISVYNMALNYAELTITAGEACLLINTAPLFTLLFSRLFLGEAVSSRFITGLCISFIGVTLIVFRFGSEITFRSGTAFAFLAAISHAAFFVLQRPLLRKYRPIEVSCYTIVSGSFFILPFGSGIIDQVFSAGFPATLAVIYLGIFPAAIANICWSSVLQKIPAARAASFLYAVPVVTLFIGYFLIQEIPSSLSLVGGAIALGGVAFANSFKKRSRYAHNQTSD